MKIGCCAVTEDLLLVQGQGYDYIELAASQLMTLTEKDFQAFLEQYRETGFPCRGFNSLCGAELPLVGPKQDLDALRTYMKALCRRGAALGIRNIGVGAPGARNPPPDWPEERSTGKCVNSCRWPARLRRPMESTSCSKRSILPSAPISAVPATPRVWSESSAAGTWDWFWIITTCVFPEKIRPS